MADSVTPTAESILTLIASEGGQPWYPKSFAESSGIPRHALDPILDRLRIAGLIELTPWEKNVGQGYRISQDAQDRMENHGSRRHTSPRRSSPVPLGDDDYARVEAIRVAFDPNTRPWLNSLMLKINVACFVISTIVALRQGVPLNEFLYGGNIRVMHELGAVAPVDLLYGEWWRLLTCCFLHFGALHLFVNMLALSSAGGEVERLWGSNRYLVIYLFSGLGGSCTAMFWDPGEPGAQRVLAGASGSLWGVLSALVAWILLNRPYLNPEVVSGWLRSLSTVFLLNILISMLPNISAAAHFGGGITGFMVACLLHAHRWNRGTPKLAALFTLIAFPLLLIGALMASMHSDPRWQRLGAVVDRQEKVRSLLELRKELAPRMAEISDRFDTLDNRWQKLLIADEAKLPELREPLTELRKLIESTRRSITEVSSLEEVERIQQAGRAYLDALEPLVLHLMTGLDPKLARNDDFKRELRQLRQQAKSAQEHWQKVIRNR